MIFYYIYCITNLINKKNYIGQHKQNSKIPDIYFGSGVLLKKAINKHGIKNFEKIVLTVCETKEQANFFERQYIKFYRLGNKAEYNITDGGDGYCLGYTKEQLEISLKKRQEKFIQFKTIVCWYKDKPIDIKLMANTFKRSEQTIKLWLKKLNVNKVNVKKNIRKSESLYKKCGVSKAMISKLRKQGLKDDEILQRYKPYIISY
jgi:hypothetical protein